MMAQYLDIKAGHPDALLFYRMGDFYEMFFDDAVVASEALDIALTKRGKHDGTDIPMCGVPFRAAEGYFLTLIRKGFRVAVCEQMENPAEAKKRGSKSVVRREVVRLVTPGTLTEDTLLEARRNNFLAAYAQVRDDAALAWADISTGAFHVMPIINVRLAPELARLTPSELIAAEASEALSETLQELKISLTTLDRSSFDSTSAEDRIRKLYSVDSLDAFGTFNRAEISAMGALLDYLDTTQKGKLPLLAPPIRDSTEQNVQIDSATRRNLELTRSLDGERSGTLLSVIDRTVTPGGGRLLEQRISNPSQVLEIIHARHASVGYFTEQSRISADIRTSLRKAPDMDRALSRLSLDRGGPRDIAAIRNALEQANSIAQICQSTELPDLLATAAHDLIGFDSLVDLLDAALIADPPILARDGGFIAPGYDPELDDARTLRDEGRSVIAGLQQQYADHTGISSLKIKHNNVLGYFIETTATHAEKMLSQPLSESYIHRQTTANQVRFTTVELSELETKILNAGGQALDIEKRLYETLKAAILEIAPRITLAARGLSEIDLASALADLALGENWCKPEVDNTRAFNIIGGRHPVVEQALRKQTGDGFIANDCDLSAGDSAAIWLLTGPNMAGKSTFLRQNALIALLAQMGSFVPAESAHIGLISQLFSRVGASDDLARGRSTFMVEMVETAAILNQADDRALVILDEIGRGTATYDGLSIAWATLEHLHASNRSRALFATHYHELTALAGNLDGVENATVAVKEWDGEVIFLHEVRKGAADRSYGVQVAKLAGLPASVVDRARVVLEMLEKGEREGGTAQKALIDDLPLFAIQSTPIPPKVSPAQDMFDNIHPDELTPREALGLLYKLKEAAKS
jgi:DNA mismatch repair protein MutS